MPEKYNLISQKVYFIRYLNEIADIFILCGKIRIKIPQ